MNQIKRLAVVIGLMTMMVVVGNLVTSSDIGYNTLMLHFLITYTLLGDIT